MVDKQYKNIIKIENKSAIKIINKLKHIKLINIDNQALDIKYPILIDILPNLKNLNILNFGKNNLALIVNCHENAKLDLLEYNQNNAFVIIKHLINLKRNSKLNFNIINDQKNYTLLTNVSLMEYNSELNFNSIYSNGLITRVKNYFYPGKNSKLNINDIVLGRNNEKFDIYSNIINNEKNVKSNLKAKAVVLGQSECLLKSISTLLENSENTYSNISHNGIIRGNGKFYSFPFILVKQKNVNATHNSSISSISEEDKFYLMTRGMDKTNIEKFLINEFIFSDLEQDYKYASKFIETKLLRLMK